MSDSGYHWLQAAVSDGGEVVTASRRLARELRAAYHTQQQASGKRAWLTPAICSWHEWLAQKLGAAADPARHPRVLDAAASLVIWERCLEQQLPGGVPALTELARQASQSRHRLAEWKIPVSIVSLAARSPDERIFAVAALDYERRLTDGHWIDSAGKATAVAELLSDGRIAAPVKATLAGFDRISPGVRQVVEALDSAGCAVSTAHAPSRSSQLQCMSYDRLDAELRASGGWARQQLNNNPEARIAIVVPSLETNAAGIARLVKEGLVPGWQFAGGAFDAAVNVSYGQKLSAYPAIAIALSALRWSHRGLSSREISLLLRSRCIASDETAGRIRLELALRRHPDRHWLAHEFLHLFRNIDDGADVTAFMECTGALQRMQEHCTEHLSPGEWATRFDSLLTTLGWPGPSALDSDEFQLINRWRELLNEFARLQVVTPAVDLGEAVRRLTALAGDTLYQPEAGPGRVQVIGMLEAAGLEFDAIWISGMDAAQWPPAATPARFVSLALQREHDMPHASPGDTLRFAKRVLHRLSVSAHTCVLSWVTTRDDLELSSTSLLDDLECVPLPAASDPGWFAKTLSGPGELFEHTVDAAPPIDADERIRGGAHTVQRQFAEPFGAFAHGRLGIRALERIETGLSPAVRGNIIHNALHTLLASNPAQDDIRAWSVEDQQARIGTAADTALTEISRHADSVLRRILSLERNRLRNLLQKFIEAESARESFSVVSLEHRLDYNRFGVTLGLRVDRVDRMADGRLMVIDYKTGSAKHFLNGNGELTDLQLIVYADALSEDVGGLALMNIDSRRIDTRGAGDSGPWSRKYADCWAETLHAWRAEVHRCLRCLAAGDVRLNLRVTAGESRPLNILSRKEELNRAG